VKNSNYHFKPNLWLLFIAVLALALFIRLGYWQLSRAEEKEAQFLQLQTYAKQPAITIPPTLVDLEGIKFRRAEVRGYLVAELTVLLDNKVYNGVAGYHVLTPLRIENSNMHVLVNRGWIAAGANRMELPKVNTPAGHISIIGTVISPDIKTIALSTDQVSGKVWQNFELARYQEMVDIVLQPIMLLQDENVDWVADGLIRKWERPDSGSAKNFGYAVQWFSLAVVTFFIYILLNVKRKDPQG